MQRVWAVILFVISGLFLLGGVGSFFDDKIGNLPTAIYGLILGLCLMTWGFRRLRQSWALKIPNIVIAIIAIGGFVVYAFLIPPKTISDVPQADMSKAKKVSSTSSLSDFIKEIVHSDDIQLTEQVDAKGTYLADIRINKDPFMGGQSDWNMVAGETFTYCKKILENPAISRLHFTFFSPENKNVDWAHIWIKRKDLPENWRDSYQYFFSVVQVDASTVSSGQWLCDFYNKYESARPHGEMPAYCSRNK